MVTFDPGCGAVSIDFFFPDGEAVFDVVDNVAAGQKGVAPVVGGDSHPYRDVARGEGTDSVDDRSVFNMKLGFGLIENGLRNVGRELRVATVVELFDDFTLVVVAHPTLVAAIRAGAEREQLFAQCRRVDGLICELEGHLNFIS